MIINNQNQWKAEKLCSWIISYKLNSALLTNFEKEVDFWSDCCQPVFGNAQSLEGSKTVGF